MWRSVKTSRKIEVRNFLIHAAKIELISDFECSISDFFNLIY